jgi:hypothetical protein
VREFVRAWRVVMTMDGRSWARHLVNEVNAATRRAAEGADAADSSDQQRDGEAWRAIVEILLANKSAARCSATCTAKWWDRSRRKAARHSQYQGSEGNQRSLRRNS